jgi:hypothetical protein
VADVVVEGLPQGGLKAKTCGDFQIDGYIVEFYGTCKDYQESLPV